jgi:hypothetical protein
MTDLEARVRRLEDLEEIRALAVRYGFAVDERDSPGICSSGCLPVGAAVSGVAAMFASEIRHWSR